MDEILGGMVNKAFRLLLYRHYTTDIAFIQCPEVVPWWAYKGVSFVLIKQHQEGATAGFLWWLILSNYLHKAVFHTFQLTITPWVWDVVRHFGRSAFTGALLSLLDETVNVEYWPRGAEQTCSKIKRARYRKLCLICGDFLINNDNGSILLIGVDCEKQINGTAHQYLHADQMKDKLSTNTIIGVNVILILRKTGVGQTESAFTNCKRRGALCRKQRTSFHGIFGRFVAENESHKMEYVKVLAGDTIWEHVFKFCHQNKRNCFWDKINRWQGWLYFKWIKLSNGLKIVSNILQLRKKIFSRLCIRVTRLRKTIIVKFR